MTRQSLLALPLLCAATLAAQAIPAQKLLDASGIKGGLIVHIGGNDARSTLGFRANDRYLVHALHADPAKIAQARRDLLEAGVYGPVSVDLYDGPTCLTSTTRST